MDPRKRGLRWGVVVTSALCLGLPAQAGSEQVSPVLSLLDFSPIADAESEVKRKGDKVSIKMETWGEPGHAYTLWAMIFNNPAACATVPCSIPDLFNPATEASAIWVDGDVADDSDDDDDDDGDGDEDDDLGELSFKAKVKVGDPPGEVQFGPALLDGEAAEIQLVVLDHGPAIDEILEEQTTTSWGGCDIYPCRETQISFQLP